MRPTFLAAVALLCLSAATACSAPRIQPVCGILYARDPWPGDTTAYLRLIEPGSGVEHALQTLPAEQVLFNGGLSPDGISVLYTISTGPTQRNLWIMPLDGSEPRPLLSDDAPPRHGGANWCFDGSKAAFSARVEDATYPNTQDYYVVDVATGTATRLPVRGWTYAWSPKDHRIAILCSSGNNWGVWVIDTDTGERKRLLSSLDMREAELAWSPDAKEIAVVGGIAVEHIFIADVQEGAGRVVTRVEGYTARRILGLSWSSKGDKIAFVTNETTGGDWTQCTDLVVVDLNTGRETRLAEEVMWGPLTWSPDGTEIAFGKRAADNVFGPMYKVDVFTGRLTQLTDSRGPHTILAWRCVTYVPEQGQ